MDIHTVSSVHKEIYGTGHPALPGRQQAQARDTMKRNAWKILATLLVTIACALPAVAQSDETAKSFHVLPHLADGGVWRSFLIVTNVSEAASPCTLQLYGLSVDRFEAASGVTAAGSTATFELPGAGGYLVWRTRSESAEASGYATLDCVNPVVAQVLFASIDESREPTGMATVFSSQAGTVFQFPVLTPAATLGFAIANDTNAEVSCGIVLQDPQRTNLGEATLSVPDKSNRAQLLNDAISIPGTFLEGSATVSCDQPVEMIGLHFELRPDRSIITFNTLPPAVLDTSPPVDSSTPTVTMSERAALGAFYDATGGPGWDISTNWKTAAPLDEWHGVETDADGRIIEMDINENGLRGTIPPELGKLTQLLNLSLGGNDLSGAIPAELGKLPNLQVLSLGDNDLSGTIPSALDRLTHLQRLVLYRNRLSGTIPAWLSNFTHLQELSLGGNELSGTIPAELGNLPNLQRLWLSSNDLIGAIPPELGNLPNLQRLYLGENALSGAIPPELGRLTRLRQLLLDHNDLSGTIPPELGNLTNLEVLFLHVNRLSGTIPPVLGKLTQLSNLSLGGNDLIGAIPAELGKLPNLQGLSLGDNDLSGTIPPELGNLTNLQGLSLWLNELSGAIPPELGNLTHLEALLLQNNELSGTIPAALGNLTHLEVLHLFGNKLSGMLPSSLTNLRQLREFWFQDNAGLCAPATEEFQEWLRGIIEVGGGDPELYKGPTCSP